MTRDDRNFVALVGGGIALTCAIACVVVLSAPAPTPASAIARAVIAASLVLGTVGALAPLMQLRRIIATHSARDVSLLFLGFYGLTCVTGVAMGLVLRQPAIYVANSVAMVTVLTTVITATRMRWIYRHYDAIKAVQDHDAAAGAHMTAGTITQPAESVAPSNVVDISERALRDEVDPDHGRAIAA